MTISLQGRQGISAMTGATGLPPADVAPERGALHQEMPNLTISEAPQASESRGIPPAELERAMTRDDGLGKIVDRALAGVPTAVVDAAIAEMLKK